MENVNKRKSSSSTTEPVTNKKPKLVDVNREKSLPNSSTEHVKKVGKPPTLPTKKAKQEAAEAKHANLPSKAALDAATERRAKRQEKYDPQQELEKLRQKGRELAPRVAPVLIHETRNRLEAEATSATGNRQHSKLYNSHSQIVIPTTSPAWQDVPLDLAVALVQYSLSGCFDPKPFVANGVLELCTGDMEEEEEEEAKHCQFYLRFVPIKGRQAIATAITKTLSLHPQEAPNSLTKLTVLGHGPESFREAIEHGWSPLGLETVANKLCDIIAEAPKTTILHNSTPSSSSEPSCLLYAGMTTEDPAQRVVNDLKGGIPCRFTNFCNANNISSSDVKTYRVVNLAVPITSSLETRTNKDLGNRERILIALLGELSLNSALGGAKPTYEPHPELVALRDHVFSLLPSTPFPLGQEEMTKISHFKRISPEKEPSERYIRYTKDVGLGALRQKDGRVVVLNVTKDIPRDGFSGRLGGYFDEATGIGPMADRYVQTLVDPSIPLTGNLTVQVLAFFHGAFIDFWRFIEVLCPPFWWLFLLFLTRILNIVRPILVVTQSNPVAKIFHTGFLAQPRAELYQGNADFANGETTADFVHQLRQISAQRFQGDEFFRVVGIPTILPIGPGAQLTIHIALPDYGAPKYTPQRALPQFILFYILEIIIFVFKRIIAFRLETCPMSKDDWEDETKTRRWLEATVAEANTYLEDVYAALEVAKEHARELMFTHDFLSSLSASYWQHQLRLEEEQPRPQIGPITRRSGLLAAPLGEARVDQAKWLMKLAEHLKSYGLSHDPYQVESYGMEIGSERWYQQFVKLKEGVQIRYSANANGKTAEAAAASQKSRENIAVYRPDATSKEDEAPKRLRHLKNLVTFTSTLSTDKPTNKLEECSRFGICNSCKTLLAADTNYITHECGASSCRIDMAICPKLERSLYVHDVEEFLPQLGLQVTDLDDSLKRFTVGEIFGMEGQLEALKLALPQDGDFNAIVGGSDTFANAMVYTNQSFTSPRRLLTLAVDRILHSQSRSPISKTPAYFEPLKNKRRAWEAATRTKLEGWLVKRQPKLFFRSCRGEAGDKPQWTSYGTSAKLSKSGARLGKLKMNGESENLFYLPHHFSRAAWYMRALKLGWLQ
ncbi:hypothetical protein MIND_00672600 [Mycena indigotica]|uniref:Uncharacterized protein n=1 Tax=Mycena indigotica TaxID=2126181 RepID=A0A8H6SKJ1_9AGAR|nr:uncharacterized protein MIND_00672600 [Mycena indigotica]KAF7301086.1 hypothetical protein MIND_00672600 [Mycena indigotica]